MIFKIVNPTEVIRKKLQINRILSHKLCPALNNGPGKTHPHKNINKRRSRRLAI